MTKQEIFNEEEIKNPAAGDFEFFEGVKSAKDQKIKEDISKKPLVNLEEISRLRKVGKLIKAKR